MRFWTKAVAMSLLGYFTIAMASAQTKSTTGDQPGKTLQPRFDSARFLKDHDKNSDGKLSKDELPAAAQKDFERLDANKDGFISQDELQKHAETMSHQRPELVEIFFYAIDIPEEPATTQELQAATTSFASSTRTTMGRSTREKSKPSANSGRKNVSTISSRPPPEQGREDHEGRRARGLWSDNFAQIDKNGDGALDRQEIEAACAAEHSQHHKGQGQEQPNSKK